MKRKSQVNNANNAKKQNTQPTPQIASTQPQSTSTIPPQSEYKRFLNTHIIPKLSNTMRNQSASWEDVSPGDVGEIINEIAKKFNNHAILGINDVKYKNSKQGSSGYAVNQDLGHGSARGSQPTGTNILGRTEMGLAKGDNISGPNPRVVGHELVHANDHQIDSLTPLIWDHMRTLATTGANNNSGMTLQGFLDSMKRIQDKIDPTGVFSSNYDVDHSLSGNDWPGRFDNITNIMGKNYVPEAPSMTNMPKTGPNPNPNRYFMFNHASEYPAFLSEKLTGNLSTGRPTGTQVGRSLNTTTGALSLAEAQFVDNVLREMENAYPAQDYPRTNYHIGQRRNSLQLNHPAGSFTTSSNSNPGGSSNSNTLSANNNPLQNMMAPSATSTFPSIPNNPLYPSSSSTYNPLSANNNPLQNMITSTTVPTLSYPSSSSTMPPPPPMPGFNSMQLPPPMLHGSNPIATPTLMPPAMITAPPLLAPPIPKIPKGTPPKGAPNRLPPPL